MPAQTTTPPGVNDTATTEIGTCVGKECRSRWSPYHFAAWRPRETDSRRHIVPVGVQRNGLAFNVVAAAEAEQQIRLDLPCVLQKDSRAWKPGPPVRIAEPLL